MVGEHKAQEIIGKFEQVRSTRSLGLISSSVWAAWIQHPREIEPGARPDSFADRLCCWRGEQKRQQWMS